MTITQIEKKNVIVVDPRSFLRGCLFRWLEEQGGDFQPTVVADASTAFTVAPPDSVALALLSMPSMASGPIWLEEQVILLRECAPSLPIVIIMDEASTKAGAELTAKLGLQGYIPMSTSLEVAAAALRLVIAGGRYFPHPYELTPEARALAIQPQVLKANGQSMLSPLTPREQAVLDLVATGLPNKIIAYRLGLSVGTVTIHVL
jgi:DNA-binding NarL/FixJ family response regulator